MERYNPDVAPDPKKWLALDEQEKFLSVEKYHRAKRIELPDLKIHAVMHAVVENQIAEGYAPSVRAMARLQAEGLSRHDALHAIASIVIKYFSEAMQDPDAAGMTTDRLGEDIDRLTKKSWYEEFGI